MLVKAVVDGRDELAEDPIGQMRMHRTKAMPQSDGEGNGQAAEDGKPAEWHDRWRDEPGPEPLVGPYTGRGPATWRRTARCPVAKGSWRR
jgi:hypothetical protein